MRRLRTLAGDQRGFTMVTVMLSMMMLGAIAVGAWETTRQNIPIAKADQTRKTAYEAAMAGIQWYAAQLGRDPSYWTQCSVTGQPVVQKWSGSGVDTRTGRYASVPGTQEQFVIELMPAPGSTACSTSSPSLSMLDGGNLKVRATGLVNGDKRQIVATFRRKTFLNYIYFTDRETLAPVAYAGYSSMVSAGYDATWAQSHCSQIRSQRDSHCLNIQFLDTDNIRGPLHTNDESLLICNSPTFGRNAGDQIEIVGTGSSPNQASVFVAASGCSENPDIQGRLVPNSATLDMPPSNGSLAAVADYTYRGNTCLDFQSDGTIRAYNQSTASAASLMCTGSYTTIPSRAATVIYVDNTTAGCTADYDYNQMYNNPAACGDVMVKGTVPNAVTVASRNDIIIGNDLRRGTNGIIGLIANNFVRVYHPVNWSNGSCTGDATPASGLANPNNIDAAILALNQSFIVDNWWCGGTHGNLNVTGAIAQRWRGPVGTSSNGVAQTGYVKNYVYDDRLRYTSPPQFLDPVQSAWGIMRMSEQAPST